MCGLETCKYMISNLIWSRSNKSRPLNEGQLQSALQLCYNKRALFSPSVNRHDTSISHLECVNVTLSWPGMHFLLNSPKLNGGDLHDSYLLLPVDFFNSTTFFYISGALKKKLLLLVFKMNNARLLTDTVENCVILPRFMKVTLRFL